MNEIQLNSKKLKDTIVQVFKLYFQEYPFDIM